MLLSLLVVAPVCATTAGAQDSRGPADPGGVASPRDTSAAAGAANAGFPFRLFSSDNFNMLEPNYFISGLQDAHGRDSLGAAHYANQVKFRVAVRYRIVSLLNPRYDTGLHFGYVQNSFWNLYENSAPFFDNNYNPMVFLYADARDWTGGQPGYSPSYGFILEHESNGRDGHASRGWNRWSFRLDFGDEREKDVSVVAKAWIPFGMEADNPKLPDYAGRGEVTTYIKLLGWANPSLDELGTAGSTVKLRVGGRNLVTSAEINLYLQPERLLGRASDHLNSSIVVQLFTGTAENLLDYNVRRTMFRFGFATVK